MEPHLLLQVHDARWNTSVATIVGNICETLWFVRRVQRASLSFFFAFSFFIFIEMRTFSLLGQFKMEAKSVFGAGWVWLADRGRGPEILSTFPSESPIALNAHPILCLDLWEHSYFPDFHHDLDVSWVFILPIFFFLFSFFFG
jgi:hypothetical protein